MDERTRSIAPTKFRDALKHLTKHEVPLSKAVTAATKELDRIEGLKPRLVDAQTLAARFHDVNATAADIVTLAAEVTTHQARSQAYRYAWTGAALAGLNTIAQEAADIVESLRPAAEAHLENITWFADEGSPDVSSLVRDHRTDDAQMAATAPLAYADWQALVKMRRDLSGRHFDWTKAGTFANPEHVATAMQFNKGLTGLDYICTAIRAGGILWWPSMDQAAEVSGRVIDAEDKANADHAAEQSLQYHSAL